MLEGLLRAAALIIALLALIDPTLTIASRQRPIVALSIVESPSLARPIASGKTGVDRARQVQAQVADAGAGAFDVREGPVPDAAAQVLIGDGSFPGDTPLIRAASVTEDANGKENAGANGPLYAVIIDDAPSPNVRVSRIDAPARTQLGSRVRVNAIVEARGMMGRTSTITLRVDDLEMARATHAWTQAVETATIALDAIPFRTGVTRLTVAAEPLAMEVTTEDNSVEGAIDVTNEKIGVLVVDARPSWATRFARQALEADERFDIKTLSRVSRGLTSATPDTPQTLTRVSLEPFAAVIVGAPDALARADVDALREFARVRGGLVIFAPDRTPSGAYVDLLPARTFEEKLQEAPRPIRLDAALNADAADSAGAFAASELAVPSGLLPGAEVLGRVGDPHTGAPLIVSSPAGDGEVVFIGALDAWRFRTGAAATKATTTAAAGDINSFDAAWRQLVATLGARVTGPISVTLDTPVVTPGARVSIRVRLRRTLVHADGSVPPLIARVGVIDSDGPRAENRPRRDGDGAIVRLWPGDQQGLFIGTLNAPSRTGVYAVSVGFDRSSPGGQAALVVASKAPVAAVAWDGLRTFVDAHGGLVTSAADIPRLIEDLQHRVHASTPPRARHPFRSAWWMAPFAACLGGEWWLRRRRGQR